MEQPWELFRRGQLDQERHHRLVRDAIRKNLADLVAHGTITAGGRVRIPIKALRQWRFEFDPDQQDHTGTFGPDPLGGAGQGQQPGGRPRKGDIVGYRPSERGQAGGQGGEGDGGEAHYEVEVGLEAVSEALFADLELPRMQRKQQAVHFTEEWKMEDIRRRGAISNLDKRRTALENIRRNAAAGSAAYGGLIEEDLRFRTPDVKRVPQDRVAVLFIRDCSASMGEEEKYLTRTLAFWITRFLQFKYRKVAETAFITFHVAATEVSEEDFFHRSEGGGTVVSSGFELAQAIIEERFPPASYNLYVFAFSDGENSPRDTPRVAELARELMGQCNLVGYADIRPLRSTRSAYEWSEVAEALRDLEAENVVAANVSEQTDVIRAMRRFFRKREQAGAPAR